MAFLAKDALECGLSDERPVYKNAPIAEAILEITCALGDGVKPEQLLQLQADEAERYPVRRTMEQTKTSFIAAFGDAVAPSQQPMTERKLGGYASLTKDELWFTQFGINGFVLARRRPYTRWDELRNEARRLWTKFVAVAKPTLIQQVGIRVINRIELPPNAVRLADYLKFRPAIPAQAGSILESFMLQTAIPQPGIKAGAFITAASDESDGASFPVLLDIDVVRAADLPAIDGDELWDILDQMSRRKSELFEACITDSTRELFR